MPSGKTRATGNRAEHSEGMIAHYRFRETSEKGRTINVEAESDRSRVIFCEAFRLLHRKAQVFSLDEDGYARTRLTHSLEVSQVGRYLAQVVLDKMDRNVAAELGFAGKFEAIQVFVETACLVHDIGNPPFGHFGETAIKHWYASRKGNFQQVWLEGDLKREKLFDTLYDDFINFDGNPQGFRILTRLMWATDEHSLNLTMTQLASTIKYACSPTDVDTSVHNTKKAGYFYSEKSLVEKIYVQLGMNAKARHPLVYLMEAADDIAYCLSDIEDAIRKGIFSELDVLERIRNFVSSDDSLNVYLPFLPTPDKAKKTRGALLLFRVKAINYIVPKLAEEYVIHHTEFHTGIATPLVDRVQVAKKLLDLLKDIARSHIYSSPTVLRNELIGSKVITGILNAYAPLMWADRQRFDACLNGQAMDEKSQPISSEYALFKQIPENYVLAYLNAVSRDSGEKAANLLERFHRTHMIIDYLTGLTDSQATDVFKLVCGGG